MCTLRASQSNTAVDNQTLLLYARLDIVGKTFVPLAKMVSIISAPAHVFLFS